MATTPERPPFVLSDYNIVSLSRNSALTAQFPWLAMRSVLVKRSCCGKPARVDQRLVKTETDRIRNFVAGMSQVDLVKFKQAIGQSRIRILYPDGTTKDRA